MEKVGFKEGERERDSERGDSSEDFPTIDSFSFVRTGATFFSVTVTSEMFHLYDRVLFAEGCNQCLLLEPNNIKISYHI